MYFAICTSCLEDALKDTNVYHSFLSLIVNSKTPYKILNDSDGKIFDSYKELLHRDNIGFLTIWCDDLINNSQIKRVEISNELIDNIYINTLINFYKKRNLITSDSNINSYDKIIADYDISVNDSDEICNIINSKYIPTDFDYLELTKLLIRQLSIMMDRKQTMRLENLHNDELTLKLESEGYFPADQTRRGTTGNQGNPGSLDILIKSSCGNKVSIIEALRESSCGQENTNIAKHLNKLMNDYDTCGLKVNYFIVYCEAADFGNFWNNYKSYINNINSKTDFSSSIPQKVFSDTLEEISTFTDIRVARAIHDRNGRDIEVYHIVCNMFVR